MTCIGDNLRTALEADAAQAAARRARAARLRRSAELDWRQSLHPEADPFAASNPGWTAEARTARERFRRAHATEMRARDREAGALLGLEQML